MIKAFRSVTTSLLLIALVSIGPATGCGSDSDVDQSAAFRFVNLRVEEISATRAIVRFDTSVETTCEAEFGNTSDNLDKLATDPSMVAGQLDTKHDIPLEDLAPDTTYYYRARATDGAGRTARSQILSFKTPAAGSQSVKAANIALITAGATVSSVSSNFGGVIFDNTSSFGANKALDGQMATQWATDGDADEAFMMIDLGQMRSVSRIGFRSRKMEDGSAIIKSFQVVFMDQSVAGPFETPDPDQRYEFILEAPVATRTVRLEAVTTTGGNTGIREFELFEAPEK